MEGIKFLFFEWNTTGLSRYNGYKLQFILSKCFANDVVPIFLILPSELNLNDRVAELQIKNLKNEIGLPVIDLRNYFDHKIFNTLVRDHVHTTALGAELYANVIYDNFLKIAIEGVNIKYDFKMSSGAKNLKPRSDTVNRIYSSGDEINILIQDVQSYAELIFRHQIGPHSPNIEIRSNNLQKSMNFWDAHCFYEREAYHHILFPDDCCSISSLLPIKLNISMAHTKPDYSLSRRPDFIFNHPFKIKLDDIYSVGLDYILLDD